MRTALGLYVEAKDRAHRCRRLACRAAAAGRRLRACNLIEAARRYDDRAEEWEAVVPEWQWRCL